VYAKSYFEELLDVAKVGLVFHLHMIVNR